MQSPSTLPPPLKRLLQKTRRRLRQRTLARLLPPALTVGLLVTLLLIGCGWLYPLAHPLWLLVAGLGLTGLVLGGVFLYALLRSYDPLALGRLLDRRLQLDERVSTALELAVDKQRRPAPIIQAQLADTLRHLAAVDLNLALPLRLSWPWLIAGNFLVIAIIAGLLLPNPQLRVLQQRATEKQLLAHQKNRLEQIRVDLLNNEALQELPETEAALQTLESLIEELEADALSPEETLAGLGQAEQALTALQEALNQDPDLNDLAQSFGQFQATTDLAEALRRRDFKRAAEFLDAAAGNSASSPADNQTMADALRQAAQTARQNGAEELAAALSEAAAALDQAAHSQATQGTAAQSETQAAREALQQAAEALTEAGQANQEALEEALGNIQEAREQLAQADGPGQNQAGQSNQGQPGQGQEQGQGQAQPGQGQGQGAAPFDAPGEGSGSGRGDSGAGRADLFADRPGGALEMDNSPNQGRSDDYQADYPPIHWGGEGGPLVNPDRQGAEGGLPIGDAPVNPNQEPNPALVPYNQVYGQYAGAAGEALEDAYIPLGMKEYVRNYFGALEPE